MKILFAGASGDRYGADAVLMSIAAHMHAGGADCLLILPESGRGAEAARAQGLRVAFADTSVLRRADLTVTRLGKLSVSLPRSLLRHIRLIRDERPDVVWVNTVTLPAWVVAARLCGVPVVCHSHETVGSSPWLRHALYLPLFATTRVIAVSTACGEDIGRTYPRLRRLITVMLNPSFAVAGRVPHPSNAERDVVFIGRISERKGLGVLMDALADPPLAALEPTVHICGTAYDSDSARRFERWLKRRASSLPASIHFHGYVPTTNALSLGGIVVMASIEPESCPLVLAEALTAGRAVVATECGGVAELVDAAAVLVPPRDPVALAGALAGVIRDRKKRVRLVEASLVRAEALSASTYLAEVERVIRSITAERMGPVQSARAASSAAP